MSTSKLQRHTSEQLYKRFGKYGLVENTRPRWLVSSKGERLELDFFIDKLSVAIEVQGRQHKEFTPYFHETKHDYDEQLRRDKEKKEICGNQGITLLYINIKSDVGYMIANIIEIIDRRLAQKSDEDVFNVLTYRRPKEKIKGIEQIKNAMKGYERCLKRNKEFSKKGFNILCAGIERIFESGKLSEDEWPILAKAIWLKKELASNY